MLPYEVLSVIYKNKNIYREVLELTMQVINHYLTYYIFYVMRSGIFSLSPPAVSGTYSAY